MLDLTGKPFPDLRKFGTVFLISETTRERAKQDCEQMGCDAIRFFNGNGPPGAVAAGYSFKKSE